MAELFEIRDFLEPEFAEEAHAFLNEGMPRHWWYAVSLPPWIGPAEELKSRSIPDSDEAQERIAARRGEAEEAMVRGEFAYFYFRTFDHEPGCNCVACRVIEHLRSQETCAAVAQATGEPLQSPGEFYCSRLVSGCFLGRHSDKGNGRISAILNLTRDWNPEYGGLLNLMADGGPEVSNVVFPRFNSLVGFTLPAGIGRQHFVSHVAPNVYGNRLAVNGFYR